MTAKMTELKDCQNDIVSEINKRKAYYSTRGVV